MKLLTKERMKNVIGGRRQLEPFSINLGIIKISYDGRKWSF